MSRFGRCDQGGVDAIDGDWWDKRQFSIAWVRDGREVRVWVKSTLVDSDAGSGGMRADSAQDSAVLTALMDEC